MNLVELVRPLGRYLKSWRHRDLHRYLQPVRRITRVAPVPGRRLVAMTFDDGPTVATAHPHTDKQITPSILDSLARYGARGTFDVIGTTSDHYPDKPGKLHTAMWNGIRYDHYPYHGLDEQAGVVHQPGLAQRMVDEGHELANHSYIHLLFGRKWVVYRTRRFFQRKDAVLEDARKLHDYVREHFGFEMKLARPPHYVDNVPGGFSAYDIYEQVGYQYLAASFDGGGWKPTSGDYQQDVEAMVDVVQRALEKDPASLNGQIIFQKDGYNMSLESPIVDALPRQLELLSQEGYEVVTVSELLAASPFADAGPGQPGFDTARALLETGHTVAYGDNQLRLEDPLTHGELAVMLISGNSPGATQVEQLERPNQGKKRYRRALEQAREMGLYGKGDGKRRIQAWMEAPVETEELGLVLERWLDFYAASVVADEVAATIDPGGEAGDAAREAAIERRLEHVQAEVKRLHRDGVTNLSRGQAIVPLAAAAAGFGVDGKR